MATKTPLFFQQQTVLPEPQEAHPLFRDNSRPNDLATCYSESVYSTDDHAPTIRMSDPSVTSEYLEMPNLTRQDRVDSAVPTIHRESRSARLLSNHLAMFRFSGYGENQESSPKSYDLPPKYEESPKTNEAGLKRKRPFANLRQSIKKADIPGRIQQVIGMKRPRDVIEYLEGTAPTPKVARRFELPCPVCHCRAAHQHAGTNADLCPLNGYSPCVMNRQSVSSRASNSTSWSEKLGMFLWAGDELEDFRRAVVAAESEKWMMED